MTFETEPRDHRFFGFISVLAALVILLGFGNTYGAKLVGGVRVDPAIIHLHAAVFTCWLLLFVAQAALARMGRIELHQRVGAAGLVLAGFMLILGVQTGLAVARAGHRGIPGVMFPDARGFLLLNLASIFVFVSLALAGWLMRGRPQAHKRLMVMATVGGLGPPGIARLPLVAGHLPAVALIAIAFLLAGPIYDLVTRRRVHPAYIVGFAVSMLGTPPVVELLSTSGAWQSIAAQLIG
jgi:hypothetical protein